METNSTYEIHNKYSVAFYAYYKNAKLLSVNHLHASLGSVIVTIIEHECNTIGAISCMKC